MSYFLKIDKCFYRLLARVFRPTEFDAFYLKLLYRMKMRKHLNLKNPLTFNEKIQWLKLYNRKPLYTSLVDKFEVKKYVKDLIGSEYVIPTLGIWNRTEDIDWDVLPDQFVLKTTHYGGGSGIVICKDINNFDKKEAIDILKDTMKKSLYPYHREWPYKNVQPRVIAEKYMVDLKHPLSQCLIDYKFYCFNGEPTYCQVISARDKQKVIDFFDMQWKIMPFIGLNPQAIHSNKPIEKPKNFSLMIEISKKLSNNIPFSRIDLYDINDKIYFGEITFFPNSGFGTIRPDEWNFRLGELIKLPTN